MAQTKKKKRTTKHRGNAAGMVEARGRTGRPLTDLEKKAKIKQTAAQRRQERMERPPSWQAATNRAAIATVIFAAALLLLFGQKPAEVIVLAGFMFLLYIPLGYYTDLMIHRRRVKPKGR